MPSPAYPCFDENEANTVMLSSANGTDDGIVALHTMVLGIMK